MNRPIKLKKKRAETKRMRPRLALKGSGTGHSLSDTYGSTKSPLCFVKPVRLNDREPVRAGHADRNGTRTPLGVPVGSDS